MSVTILAYPEIALIRGSRFFWQVTNGGHYVWSRKGLQDTIIIIPIHFPTDLASVPRSLWNVFPPFDGEFAEAAILHDYCYSFHNLSKSDADLIFYECMKTTGTPSWKRELLYKAVKWFGQSSYDSGPARRVTRQEAVRTLLAQ